MSVHIRDVIGVDGKPLPQMCLRGGPLDGTVLIDGTGGEGMVFVQRMTLSNGGWGIAYVCRMPTCSICPEHPAVAIYVRAAPASPIFLFQGMRQDLAPAVLMGIVTRG